ncbi:unnamed protein product [Lactuca saligna]|uniref:NAD-dependent epimerase/dehydratase domain-containing protein n=1 Tax=Lactuca saligna TaxID=75948 RepID=A0AA36A3Z5_LACSI|nr:unnamed protein product [Lactuca saligna]
MSESMKPFDYTSSPLPEAPLLPGPLGACSSRCSLSEDGEWRIILLRYFNHIGAHESGKVVVRRLQELNVDGHDYPTKYGSAIRDYIHVMDLADGHVATLKNLEDLCYIFYGGGL